MERKEKEADEREKAQKKVGEAKADPASKAPVKASDAAAKPVAKAAAADEWDTSPSKAEVKDKPAENTKQQAVSDVLKQVTASTTAVQGQIS